MYIFFLELRASFVNSLVINYIFCSRTVEMIFVGRWYLRIGPLRCSVLPSPVNSLVFNDIFFRAEKEWGDGIRGLALSATWFSFLL